MKVLLVGNYPADGQKSMQAYSQMVLGGLRAAGVEVEFMAPRAVLLRSQASVSGLAKWIGYIDKFVIFPFSLARAARRFDRTHVCDHSNGMYLFWLPRERSSVTCHDVIAIQAARGLVEGWHTGFTGKVLQALNYHGIGRARRIVCVSDLTRTHLLALRADVAPRTAVVLNALHSAFQPDPAWRATLGSNGHGALGERPYFLHVGSDHPRKNRVAVTRIFEHLLRKPRFADAQLVFVGPPPDAAMREVIASGGFGSRVQVVEDAPHALLVALYSGAQAMIFPSLNEGFGWPVIEAQACGCPVFAAGIDPLPEVGGAAAVYFDPADSARAAELVDRANFERMTLAGLDNATRFTHEEMTRKLIAAIGLDATRPIVTHEESIGTHA
ncbi:MULTISPECIES: glycosyltransferase family 1 protein [unclassified Paraburkholderia]|uniref:glycosyltransferase family 4 protein n=1 Tax=unclassified Paraburkholderia TaxID=2615204 RepID=UPI002AAF4E03|nr:MULTISPECIES: glycosyltransferase family 1 protein [unclassified Paraburkholderia]